MSKYLLEDGSGVVEAATPVELVEKLKAGGRFTEEQTNQEYMFEFAKRFVNFYGGWSPRTTSEDAFIADLIYQGWIKLVGEK